jgi:hypothetical protein
MKSNELRCAGECGQAKFKGLFSPAEQKLHHPICISCRREIRKKYRIRDYTRNWYRQTGLVLPGSH